MTDRAQRVGAVVMIGGFLTFACAVTGYVPAASFWAAGTALEGLLAYRRG